MRTIRMRMQRKEQDWDGEEVGVMQNESEEDDER